MPVGGPSSSERDARILMDKTLKMAEEIYIRWVANGHLTSASHREAAHMAKQAARTFYNTANN